MPTKTPFFATLLSLFLPFIALGQIAPVDIVKYEGESFSMPGTAVVSVQQTSDGFIWAGAFGQGLMRYYGHDADLFGLDHGINGNVRKIVEDKRGHLWVGMRGSNAQKGGLRVSSRPVLGEALTNDFTFVDSIGQVNLLPANINDLAVDIHGRIWAVSGSSIYAYEWSNDTSLVAIDISSQIADPFNFNAMNVLPLSSGNVWLSFEKTNWIYEVQLLPGREVIEIVDSIDIGYKEGINIEYADEQGVLWGHHKSKYLVKVNTRNGQVTSSLLTGTIEGDILPFGDSQLIVPSRDKGLLIFDKGTGEFRTNFKVENGLPTATLFCATTSFDGNLWIGAIDGLYRMPFDFKAFNHFDDKAHGSQTAIIAPGGITTVNSNLFLVDENGDRSSFSMAGYIGGLLIMPDNENAYTITSKDGLPSEIFLGAVQDNNGGIYLTTIRDGIFYLRPGGQPHPAATRTIPAPAFGSQYKIDQINSYQLFLPYLLELPGASKQSLWLGQINSVWCLADENKWIEFNLGIDSPGSEALYIQQDQKGFIHVMTRVGWYRSKQPFTQAVYDSLAIPENLSDDGFAFRTEQPIFEQVPIVQNGNEYTSPGPAILIDEELWIGCDSMLLVADPQTGQILRAHEFTSINHSPEVITYADDVVWIGTKNGLFAIGKKDMQVLEYVREEDGLLENLNWSPNGLAITKQGIVLQGTSKGLQTFNSKLNIADDIKYPVHLVRENYRETEWGKNEYTASYTLLSYRDEVGQIKYQTRLLGYDDDWSEPTEETNIRYTNLSAYVFPKTYEFQVRATDYRGQISQTGNRAYAITVNPPIYFRWWAILLYVAALVFGIRTLLKFRLKEQEKQIRLEEADTIRKQRDAISAKNQENETLLKEIHHRVKNNLEVVSSLLELQSASLADGDARDAMLSGQSRVASMGLLHQKLYQGHDLSTVNMETYLKELVESISETYEVGRDIDFRVQVAPDLELDVDRAVPVGLITNELVTNSIKYAFEVVKESPKVEVAMSQIENKMVLAVRDNGGGKSDYETKGTGFGTQLVSLLTRQLGGKMKEKNEGGYRVEISF